MTIGNFTLDLTQIILAILAAIFAYITKVVIPLIHEKIEEMKQNGEANKVAAIQTAVKIGTYSAEQLYTSLQWEEKLKHAMSVAEAELDNRGIKIDFEMLRNYVEASVRQLRIEQGQIGKTLEEEQNG